MSVSAVAYDEAARERNPGVLPTAPRACCCCSRSILLSNRQSHVCLAAFACARRAPSAIRTSPSSWTVTPNVIHDARRRYECLTKKTPFDGLHGGLSSCGTQQAMKLLRDRPRGLSLVRTCVSLPYPLSCSIQPHLSDSGSPCAVFQLGKSNTPVFAQRYSVQSHDLYLGKVFAAGGSGNIFKAHFRGRIVAAKEIIHTDSRRSHYTELSVRLFPLLWMLPQTTHKHGVLVCWTERSRDPPVHPRES